MALAWLPPPLPSPPSSALGRGKGGKGGSLCPSAAITPLFNILAGGGGQPSMCQLQTPRGLEPRQEEVRGQDGARGGGSGQPRHPGAGGRVLPKPLCVSNKPSPARLPLVCLISPPRTCPGSSCRRRAPASPSTRGAVGSLGICSTGLAAPEPRQSPAMGSRGARRAPSLSGCPWKGS